MFCIGCCCCKLTLHALVAKHPGSWHGIACAGGTRVTSVVLPGEGISGPLPTSLGNLTMLQQLILPNNGLNGTIPESIRQLTALAWLDLSNNSLAGRLILDHLGCGNLSHRSL